MQTATNLSNPSSIFPRLHPYQTKFLDALLSARKLDMNSIALTANRHSKSLQLWSYVLCRAAQSGEVETVYSKDGAVNLAAQLRSLGFEARAYRNFVRGSIASGKFSLKVKTV